MKVDQTDILAVPGERFIRHHPVCYIPMTGLPAKITKMNLEEFLSQIRDGVYKVRIEKLRGLKGNLKKEKSYKGNLPAVAMGGFLGSISATNYVEDSSEAFMADIDNIGDRLEEFKKLLSTHPSVIACFISPRGEGLKVLFKVESIKNDAHFKQIFEVIIIECFALDKDLMLDKNCKNVSRLCYVSDDSDIYINYNAQILSGTAFDPSLELIPLVSVPARYVVVNQDEEDTIIAKITGMYAKANSENSNRHCIRIRAAKYAGGCIAGGLIDEQKILDCMIQLSDNVADGGETSPKELSTINSALEKGKLLPISSLIDDFDKNSEKDLAVMQKKYALFNIGGSIGLIDGGQLNRIKESATNEVLSFYKRSDGNLLLERYAKEHNLFIDCKKFYRDSKTHVFNEIAFSPLPKPNTTINYWRGSTVIPKAGDCELIKSFLREVICGGDQTSYMYLMSYFAHMLQKPEEKPGVMIVLLGGHGIGKGTFFELLNSIWSTSTLMVNDVDRVLGRFNACLERNYIICMDEALFSGDARAISRFKNIITEPRLMIEEKNQPARSISSYHRFFAATNEEVFGKTESDDRRFFHLRVSEKHKKDFEYFAPLNEAFKNEDILGALVMELLCLDISNFNVRAKPDTEELLNQKLLSLDGFDKYWFEVLQSGSFRANIPKTRSGYDAFQNIDFYCSHWWNSGEFIATNEVKELYLLYNRNAEKYGPLSSELLSKNILKLSPNIEPTRKRINKELRLRGYCLPPLHQARADFENYIGGMCDWKQDLKEWIEFKCDPYAEDELSIVADPDQIEPEYSIADFVNDLDCDELWH